MFTTVDPEDLDHFCVLCRALARICYLLHFTLGCNGQGKELFIRWTFLFPQTINRWSSERRALINPPHDQTINIEKICQLQVLDSNSEEMDTQSEQRKPGVFLQNRFQLNPTFLHLSNWSVLSLIVSDIHSIKKANQPWLWATDPIHTLTFRQANILTFNNNRYQVIMVFIETMKRKNSYRFETGTDYCDFLVVSAPYRRFCFEAQTEDLLKKGKWKM